MSHLQVVGFGLIAIALAIEIAIYSILIFNKLYEIEKQIKDK